MEWVKVGVHFQPNLSFLFHFFFCRRPPSTPFSFPMIPPSELSDLSSAVFTERGAFLLSRYGLQGGQTEETFHSMSWNACGMMGRERGGGEIHLR